MYWPAFQFCYCLDFRRLRPHIAAIEAYKQAALTTVLPPQWREQEQNPATEARGSGEEPKVEGISGESSQFATTLAESSTVDSLSTPEVLLRKQHAARDWIKQRFAPGSGLLTLGDMLTMHRLVAEATPVTSKSAAWRTDPVQVGRREVGGIHMGAPAERIPLLMDEYIQWINNQESRSLPPVIHALLAHFFFVTLHPFGDGNGRTSRLVATAILYQRGYNVHGGFYALSDYFYRNDGIRYHTLLHRCWQQGIPFDITPFVAFGMEGMVMELRSIDSFIKMKLNRVVYREMVARGRMRRGRFRKWSAVTEKLSEQL